MTTINHCLSAHPRPLPFPSSLHMRCNGLVCWCSKLGECVIYNRGVQTRSYMCAWLQGALSMSHGDMFAQGNLQSAAESVRRIICDGSEKPCPHCSLLWLRLKGKDREKYTARESGWIKDKSTLRREGYGSFIFRASSCQTLIWEREMKPISFTSKEYKWKAKTLLKLTWFSVRLQELGVPLFQHALSMF